ncbi:hypothetical protein ACSBOB_19160 [Mesorhizobium sp. ASY16-5R]|uniref:hypothetical protein n=1 Tax=Mesorhizobium sp. ASY16-5R TaxID=3445772 RepID=UPI003F9FEB29
MSQPVKSALLPIVLIAPYAITLFLAIVGGFVALVGAIGRVEDLLRIGGAVSAFGALAFFILLLSPWANLAGLLIRGSSDDGRRERGK